MHKKVTNQTKLNFLLAIVMIGIALAGATAKLSRSREQAMRASFEKTVAVGLDVKKLPDRSKVLLSVAGRPLLVEVVNTSASLTQGLSGRPAIGSDGMLFVFPKSQKAGFWMKDMQFDLDLIWIDQNKILEITPNVPAPATPDAKLPTYSPQQPVDKVLEVPAGTAAELGLEIGSPIVVLCVHGDDCPTPNPRGK
jgi:uncharacterized membrane protein (UPF0127 family)